MTLLNAKPARIALIGVSGYGRIHLQLARESQERGEITFVAATVINPQEEAETVAWLRSIGAQIYPDYVEMLRAHAGEIDLCLIPTGIHWHARMTLAALKAGANVLVEKPLAGSTDEVAAIRRAEQDSGKFVAVGFQDLYEPGTLWLQSELARGVIGAVKSIRFLGIWPRARSYYLRNNWAGRLVVDDAPVMDSPLNNAFAHFVMLSLFFLGKTRSGGPITLTQAELLRAHAIDSFDTAVVRARAPGGVSLWFGASHACHQNIEPEVVIVGENGEAVWRYENEASWKNHHGQTERRALLDITGARRAMFQAALQRLNDPTTFVCSTEMAGAHTAFIQSIHEHGSISSVSPAQLTWSGANGESSQIPEILGLLPALRLAYETQQSLAAAGLFL